MSCSVAVFIMFQFWGPYVFLHYPQQTCLGTLVSIYVVIKNLLQVSLVMEEICLKCGPGNVDVNCVCNYFHSYC